jgi:hydroxypyruvate isomerase
MNRSSSPLNRRGFLKTSTKFAAVTAASVSLAHRLGAAEEAAGKVGMKGRINHSVCKWCYKDIPLEDLCIAGKDFGLQSIELLKPEDMETLKKHGLTCAIFSNPTGTTKDGVKVGGIEKAFNRIEHHDALIEAYEPYIKAVADAGGKQVICFSGNRDGLDDEKGIENSAIGLKRLMPIADKHGVKITMELLNSKVNHKDYMCDLSAWGVELCKAVGSENFGLLYDIYHMQIMEGDVIATIKKDNQYFAHYHTGGVPGRAEIDETQELFYPAIMKAIVDTGYKGYVAQEFIPKREDKIGSLKQAVGICDV